MTKPRFSKRFGGGGVVSVPFIGTSMGEEDRLIMEVRRMLRHGCNFSEIDERLNKNPGWAYTFTRRHNIPYPKKNHGQGPDVPQEPKGGRKVDTSWYEPAIADRAAGMAVKEIAFKYNKGIANVYRIVGPTRIYKTARMKKALEEMEIKMTDHRTFESVRHPDYPKDNRSGVRITCGECGKQEQFFKVGFIHPLVAREKFHHLGWHIGGGPRADRCAECMGKIGTDKIVPPKPAPKVTLGDVMQDAITKRVDEMKPAASAVPVNVPDANREITPKDRRAIFAELSNLHDGELGYKDDWTDEKVSVALDMPKLWIAKVREENFGPELNPIHEQAMKLRKELIAMGSAMMAQKDEVLRSAQAATAATNKFNQMYAEWTKLYETLNK